MDGRAEPAAREPLDRQVLKRAFSRFLLPFCLRDSSFWVFFNFFSARHRNRGLSILVPSDKTAKGVSPRSIPTLGRSSAPGIRARSAFGSVSTTKEAKKRPAASRITVTLEGTDDRVREHFARTSPICSRSSRVAWTERSPDSAGTLPRRSAPQSRDLLHHRLKTGALRMNPGNA
jgi:hypothetical protein